MNNLTIIGNLTRDPETKTVQSGATVTTFTVAVNRRAKGDHPEADYFRVGAWGELGNVCVKYLKKGRKVCVTGPVRAQGYMANDGTAKVSLEVMAREVEFLSPNGSGEAAEKPADAGNGYTEVDSEECP